MRKPTPYERLIVDGPTGHPDALAAIARHMWKELGVRAEYIGDTSGLQQGDLAILFDGETHLEDDRPISSLMTGQNILHLDLGINRPDHFFLSDKPIRPGAEANWAPGLEFPSLGTPSRPGPGRPLLILQGESESGLRLFSPWFESQQAWLEHMLRNTHMDFLLWLPPGIKLPAGLSKYIRDHSTWLQPIQGLARGLQAIREARFVATINSRYAGLAMAAHRIILCYGNAMYRHKGVVARMDGSDDVRQSGRPAPLTRTQIWPAV